MEEIYSCGGSLAVAITLRDDLARNKSGRVFLDSFCTEKQIPLIKIRHIDDEESVRAVATLDWLFVIGWSQIAGPSVLEAPRFGVLGMHPTLLPEGRGRAAIPWAIIKGLDRTGVTLFKLDGGVDTGPILAQEVLPLAMNETATTLYARVDSAHRRLIRISWPRLIDGSLQPVAQEVSEASVWPGRRPEDGRLDPGMAVELADRLVRGCSRPYPGAYVDMPAGRLRIWSAAIEEQGVSRPSSGPIIGFRNGTLVAKDYAWEPLEPSSNDASGAVIQD